jgi:hypothetical protein
VRPVGLAVCSWVPGWGWEEEEGDGEKGGGHTLSGSVAGMRAAATAHSAMSSAARALPPR